MSNWLPFGVILGAFGVILGAFGVILGTLDTIMGAGGVHSGVPKRSKNGSGDKRSRWVQKL